MNATVQLSKRESEIAEFLAWGECKKGVANRCHISIRTVENTARNIYVKTGVTKVNELSAWWFCTHYNISFEISPILRRTIAGFFLALFLSSFAVSDNNMLLRCRRTESCRARRTREDENFILEI